MPITTAQLAAIRYVLQSKVNNLAAHVTAMSRGGTHIEVSHNGKDPFNGCSANEVEHRLLDSGAAWARVRVEHICDVPARMHVVAIFPHGLTEVMAALRGSETVSPTASNNP